MKQLEPKVEKVSGMNFYITPFPAFKAANVSGELASMLVPFFSALAPLVGDKKSLMDVDVSTAGSSLANVSVKGNDLEKLMKTLLLGGHVVVESNPEKGIDDDERLTEELANEIFCGNVQDMFVLCYFVIRLNFSGFFDKFTTLSGKAGEVVKKKRKVL